MSKAAAPVGSSSNAAGGGSGGGGSGGGGGGGSGGGRGNGNVGMFLGGFGGGEGVGWGAGAAGLPMPCEDVPTTYEEIFRPHESFISALSKDKDIILLRIKLLLADLVHDFEKSTIDRYASDNGNGNITTLIRRLAQPYGILDDADIADLQTFYNTCTTDGAAKTNFEFMLERFLASKDILSIDTYLKDEYPLEDAEENGIDYSDLFQHLYDNYDKQLNGYGNLYWYLDAQFGNVIDKYKIWRKKNYPLAPQNKYCKDLAYIIDPASGLDSTDYDTIERLQPVVFNATYSGLGNNICLRLSPDNDGIVHLIYKDQTGDRTINIQEQTNSVNEIYAKIQTIPGPAYLRERIDLLLSKSAGDCLQVYMVNSQHWPETPIFVTNDLLAARYAILFKGSSILLTGHDSYKFYEFGISKNTILLKEIANKIRRDITQYISAGSISQGVELSNAAGGGGGGGGDEGKNSITGYVKSLMDDSLGRAKWYLRMALKSIEANQVIKFTKVRLPQQTIGITETSYVQLDSTSAYKIISDTTEFKGSGIASSKLSAGILTAIIDLAEKCNIYESMKVKYDNPDIITPNQEIILDINADMSVLYEPLFQGEENTQLQYLNMRKYMNLFSIFSQKISYNKLIRTFSNLENVIGNNDLLEGGVKVIFEEILDILRGAISSPNVPIYIISIIITIILYDLTRPYIRVRKPEDYRKERDRRKEVINQLTAPHDDINYVRNFLFLSIPTQLRLQAPTTANYRIVRINEGICTIQYIIEDETGKTTDSKISAPIDVPLETITSTYAINGFLFEFDKIKGTTNLAQFYDFIRSVIGSCFPNIDIAELKYNDMPEFNQNTYKQNILSFLSGYAESAAEFRKKIEFTEAIHRESNEAFKQVNPRSTAGFKAYIAFEKADAAYKRAVRELRELKETMTKKVNLKEKKEKERTQKKEGTKGRTQVEEQLKSYNTFIEKYKNLIAIATTVVLQTKDVLEKATQQYKLLVTQQDKTTITKYKKEKDEVSKVLRGGGGSVFTNVLNDINTLITKDTLSPSEIANSIGDIYMMAVIVDERRDIGKLYMMSAIGELRQISTVEELYWGLRTFFHDTFIMNIDKSLVYNAVTDLLLRGEVLFDTAYADGTLTLPEEEILSEEMTKAFYDYINVNIQTLSTIEQLHREADKELGKLEYEEMMPILPKNMNMTNKQSILPPLSVGPTLMSVAAGGSRKTRRRRQSRRKNKRRTQSRPRRTLRRNRKTRNKRPE